jgi:DNA-binding NarL/FixJ family response regulator
MTEKIRVLIADDQEIIREGLRIILNHCPDIEVVDVARDGAEAVHMARDSRPDIVLMDLKMPGMTGVEATRRITEAASASSPQVIILTTYDTDDWVFEGVRSGAHAYLLKESGAEAVIASIRAVYRGESKLDPAIARKVLDAFRRLSPPKPSPCAEEGPPPEHLTERESEILELIAQGLSNREIAARLSLNEGTIRNHSSKILSKLHACDRTHAVIKAARQGLVML